MASPRSFDGVTAITSGARLAYASGNLGKSVVWTTFETLILFFLVKVAGIAPSLAGGVMMFALVCEGIADFTLGYFIDRSGMARRFKAAILVFAPLCGLCFALIFVPLAPASATGAAIALIACLCCRACYTGCDIAHNTLLLAASPGGRGAGTLSGLRLVFSAAGAMLVGEVAKHLLSLPPPPPGQALHRQFALFAAAGGTIYAASLILAVRALPGSPASPGHRYRRPVLWRYAR